MKSLTILGNRRFNTDLWDIVWWNISTTLYNMAIQTQDDPSMYSVSTAEVRLIRNMFCNGSSIFHDI